MRQTKFKSKVVKKAFSHTGAGERPYGFYTEGGGASAIAGASLLSDIPLGKNKAPLGCEDGLTFLEHYIHYKAVAGNRKALREALFAYLRASGVKC